MSYLISELWPYILGAVGVVIGLVTAYIKGKSSNADGLRKQQLEAIRKKEEIKDDIQTADDDRIIAEFDRLHDNSR